MVRNLLKKQRLSGLEDTQHPKAEKKKSELKGWSPQLSIHLCFSIQRNYSPSNFKTLLKYHLEPAQVTLSYVNVSTAIYFSDEWFVIIGSVLLGTKL